MKPIRDVLPAAPCTGNLIRLCNQLIENHVLCHEIFIQCGVVFFFTQMYRRYQIQLHSRAIFKTDDGSLQFALPLGCAFDETHVLRFFLRGRRID